MSAHLRAAAVFSCNMDIVSDLTDFFSVLQENSAYLLTFLQNFYKI